MRLKVLIKNEKLKPVVKIRVFLVDKTKKNACDCNSWTVYESKTHLRTGKVFHGTVDTLSVTELFACSAV